MNPCKHIQTSLYIQYHSLYFRPDSFHSGNRMSSFGKKEEEGTKNYHFHEKEIEPSAKILDIQKTCTHCKKVPCTTSRVEKDSSMGNTCISYSNNEVHHHYENCMIEVKNSTSGTAINGVN